MNENSNLPIVSNEAKDISLQEFFSAFGYSETERIFFRTFHDADKSISGKKLDCEMRQLNAILPTLKKYNNQGFGIFVVVNGSGQTDNEVKKAGKCKAQFMEIDDKTMDEQLRIINAFPLRPSIIVKTRKSLHCYWLLTNGDIKLFRAIQERLISYFDSDQTIKNESRVMRVPSFDHNKLTPIRVEVIYFHPELKYTQQQLLEVLPEVKKNTSSVQGKIFERPELVKEKEKYLECFFHKHKIAYHKGQYTIQTDNTKVVAYHLLERSSIPWENEYSTPWRGGEDSDTLIFIRPDGTICIDGRHNTDKEHTFRDFLTYYEPKAKSIEDIKKGLKVVKMNEIECKETSFLFKPYLPFKLVIMSAYPGSGKTYIGCGIAAAVSKGYDFGNCENLTPNRKKVIYFSSEDGYEDTIGIRLKQCHADMNNVLAVEFDDNDDFDFSDSRLEDLIKEERPALVIFDTLQNFIGNVNMNAANETTRKMRALVRLADQYECCILCIAHFNKNELGSAITRTIGSTDITGKCRSYLCVGNVPDEDNTKFLSQEKCNVAKMGDTMLFEITPDNGGITFKGSSQLRADDYARLSNAKGKKPSQELDIVKDFIVRNMPDGKREARAMETLLNANGFSESTWKRAKKELGIKSKREGNFNDSTWFWYYPTDNDFEPVDFTKERITEEFDST